MRHPEQARRDCQAVEYEGNKLSLCNTYLQGCTRLGCVHCLRVQLDGSNQTLHVLELLLHHAHHERSHTNFNAFKLPIYHFQSIDGAYCLQRIPIDSPTHMTLLFPADTSSEIRFGRSSGCTARWDAYRQAPAIYQSAFRIAAMARTFSSKKTANGGCGPKGDCQTLNTILSPFALHCSSSTQS